MVASAPLRAAGPDNSRTSRFGRPAAGAKAAVDVRLLSGPAARSGADATTQLERSELLGVVETDVLRMGETASRDREIDVLYAFSTCARRVPVGARLTV
ncbi:hypothetical protein, partial [Burkholderia cenocepacia]|uniref:hypothetical protein n=1 Tax=Burkholderia cenocepacia TaxID=95486 RepID=UPI00406C53C4